MNKFIFFALTACVAFAICSPVELKSKQHALKPHHPEETHGKNEGKHGHPHHQHHLNLPEKVKQSLRQTWNEISPEAQKACENNKRHEKKEKLHGEKLLKSSKKEDKNQSNNQTGRTENKRNINKKILPKNSNK